MGFGRYIARKILWYLAALLVALLLNYFLPRLIPGNPVDALVSKMAQGGAGSEAMQTIHAQYIKEFGLDKPEWQQFLIYLKNLVTGDLGTSFGQYPRPVNDLIAESLPWSVALQLPAIIVGWLVGNLLGAIAAFKGGWFDRSAFVGSLFLSSMPYYCLAILLLFGLAV